MVWEAQWLAGVWLRSQRWLRFSWSVGEQLAARGEDIDDLGQRHPWVPNDAPLPLNYTYMQGSWRNADGSTVVVYCVLDVAAEHPDWEQQNMLKTWAAGGVRCNVRLNEAAGGAMTGTIRGLNHPSGAQLASAGLGSQHAVPQATAPAGRRSASPSSTGRA